MPQYDYQTNVYKKNRRWLYTHRLFSMFFLLGIILLASLGYLIWRNVLAPTKESTGTIENSVYVGESRSTVQSDYFSFESSIKWDFIEKDSTIPTKYVYRSFDKGITKHEVTIYHTTVPANLQVTYILPVTSPDGHQLVPGVLSPKCRVAKNASQNPVEQTYEDIKFICVPDRPEMIVAAGQSGNGNKIILTDLEDKTSTIGIFYRNLTVNPTIDILTDLIRSFKLK